MEQHDKEVEKVQYYLSKVEENVNNYDTCAMYNDSLHMAVYAQRSYARAWANAR